jgi:hypothetical protein
MSLKGELGNTGEPECFLVESTVRECHKIRKLQAFTGTRASKRTGNGTQRRRESKVSGEDSEERMSLRRAFGSLSRS